MTKKPNITKDNSYEKEKCVDNNDYIQTQRNFGYSLMMKRASAVGRALDIFLEQTNSIVSCKEPKNFWSQGNKKPCYSIHDQNLSRFFTILERCRKNHITQHITEYQYIPNVPDDYTGLYIDFDILQTDKIVIFGEDHYYMIITFIVNQLVDLLQIDDNKLITYAGVTVKTAVVPYKNGKSFKFGFHILFPGVKLTKRVKRYLYTRLNRDSFLPQYIKQLEKYGIIPPDDPNSGGIDKNSSHVPPLLVGSAKEDKIPYELAHIFKIIINKFENDEDDKNAFIKVILADELLSNDSFNAVAEFCLTYTPVNNIIPRKAYDIKSKWEHEIVDIKMLELTFKPDLDSEIYELEEIYPEVAYVKAILDILALDIENFKRNDWLRVFNILAKQGNEFKCLAKYFSSKSANWSQFEADFERNWENARIPEVWKKTLHLKILYAWAGRINPSAYNRAKQLSGHNVMWNKITDNVKQGHLGDADWAEIIYMFNKDKYIADYDPGTDDRVWYEFITNKDQYRAGELWKWRKTIKDAPGSLYKYISTDLPKFSRSVIDQLDDVIDNPKDDLPSGVHKWYMKIRENFKSSVRKLYYNATKTAILRECKEWFTHRGFADGLDQNEYTLGVGQGILLLDPHGDQEQLIVSHNDLNISRYTSVNYPEGGFNPHDPKTKKLLLAFRNMFPDEESTTHMFMACFLASTLDQSVKTGLFLLVTGFGSNGKSWLLEMMRNAYGDANVKGYSAKLKMTTITIASRSSEGADPNVMQLRDARLAHYSETNEGATLRSEIMKEFTGGEHISGRYLFKNMISFKPKAQHIVTSNCDLGINDTDFGTWRRIKCIRFKMRFYDPADASGEYEKDNPYHRQGDRDLIEKHASNPEYLSAWLSILVFYHRQLMKYYDGQVDHIPHPIIEQETREFQNSQDKLNRFIEYRIVKFVIPNRVRKELFEKYYPKKKQPFNIKDNEEDNEEDEYNEVDIENISIDVRGNPLYPLQEVIDAYKIWYDETYYPIKHKTNQIIKAFRTKSQLSKFIKSTKNDGFVVIGWRALGSTEKITNQIRFAIESVKINISESKSNHILPDSETESEYFERICQEAKAMNTNKPLVIKKSRPVRRQQLEQPIDVIRIKQYKSRIKPHVPVAKIKLLTNILADAADYEYC